MPDDFKYVVPFAPGHRVRRYVYTAPGGDLIPWESSMRGFWPGYEAKCSCGWETRTGGAVKSYIDREVEDHKQDVESGIAS